MSHTVLIILHCAPLPENPKHLSSSLPRPPTPPPTQAKLPP